MFGIRHFRSAENSLSSGRIGSSPSGGEVWRVAVVLSALIATAVVVNRLLAALGIG